MRLAGRRIPTGVLVLITLAVTAPLWSRPGPAQSAGVEVQAVSGGSLHTCALTVAGGVMCWGDNGSGELGAGTDAIGSGAPVDMVNLEEGAAAVSAGGLQTCVLTAAGGVKCAGLNHLGQLGHDRMDLCFFFPCSLVPEYVRTLESGATAVASGAGHACALTAAGGVKCWGFNLVGQLGDGGACGQVCTTPIDVPGLESGVVEVGAGIGSSCAITTAGALKCWGGGGLGDGGACSGLCPPVQVVGLESGVAAVAVGSGGHSCALTTAGGVKCWGLNHVGQLGDGGTTDSSVPVEVVGLKQGVAAISADGLHTCALTTAGAVKCWGNNSFGQLGLGVSDNDPHPLPKDVPGLEQGATAVSAGVGHTCAVLASGGVKCWGASDYGQLGDGFGCFSLEGCPRPVDVWFDGDGDGCPDWRERGDTPASGGRRDAKNVWDFFDTPNSSNVRDGVITAGDITRVVQRFGMSGNSGMDPLSLPPPPPTYHTAFDRTPAGMAPKGQEQGPNGSISAQDIALGVGQFGNTCL